MQYDEGDEQDRGRRNLHAIPCNIPPVSLVRLDVSMLAARLLDPAVASLPFLCLPLDVSCEWNGVMTFTSRGGGGKKLGRERRGEKREMRPCGRISSCGTGRIRRRISFFKRFFFLQPLRMQQRDQFCEKVHSPHGWQTWRSGRVCRTSDPCHSARRRGQGWL